MNQYTVDVWGNLNKMLTLPGSGKPTCDNLDQSANEKNQFAGFSYDAAGNLLNDGAHSYQYDPEGRIRCMDAGANCSNPAASYVYSVEGRRVKRTVSGATTLYLHEGGSVLSEFSNPSQGTGTWQKDYIYLNGALLATESAADGTRYHFSDHLGTPRVITDVTGGVISRHDYYPYGKEITAWTDGETHKFTGHERDPESSLDYMKARYYSSAQGRFLSPDEFTGGPVDAFSSNDPLPPGPLPYADITNPQSLNKYTYTYNNPLRYTDPDGHTTCPPVCVDPDTIIKVTTRVVPLAEVAAEKVASGGGAAFGFVSRVLLAGAGYLSFGAEPIGSAEDERQRLEQARQQQKEGNPEGTDSEPEPEADASSGGKKKGGKPDIRRTKPEKHGSREGAEEQLESIESSQRKLNINSVEKSKQTLKKKLKDIKSSEDVKPPDQ